VPASPSRQHQEDWHEPEWLRARGKVLQPQPPPGFVTAGGPPASAPACYAKDTCAGAPAGCTPQLKVVSVDTQGNVLLGAQNALGSDGVPSISPDGH